MKTKILLITIISAFTILVSIEAKAGPETKCYAYGDANMLAYCLRNLSSGGIIKTVGMDRATAQIYAQVNSQPVTPPTVIPSGYYYPPVSYTAPREANPVAVVGNVAASMMMAAAWAHNWNEGYIGAQGLYGASYLMNYPW